jgi:hypothetical protein
MLMMSFGSTAGVLVACVGISTSGVIGIKAGEGFAFFFGFFVGLLLELCLFIRRNCLAKAELKQN